MSHELKDVKDLLLELLEDNTVPRNVKTKLQGILSALNEDAELSLRVNKALNILDEISDDNNIQTYTRTQLWNIASVLESLG